MQTLPHMNTFAGGLENYVGILGLFCSPLWPQIDPLIMEL